MVLEHGRHHPRLGGPGRFEKTFGKKPTWEQTGDYSATTQDLNAVVRAGGDNGEAMVKALEGHRFNDFYARDAYIRPQDHRVTLNVYTVQVKSKAEAKEPGDYFKRTAIIPAAKAFTPLSESRCKMQ
ncbi:MAG: ABC transporter substrate-binding protein [Deinococcus sp.]